MNHKMISIIFEIESQRDCLETAFSDILVILYYGLVGRMFANGPGDQDSIPG